MEALVISVDEPQLGRCLESVREQTLKFSRAVHINNVSPEYIAFNRGMGQIVDEWVMKIDGDFILHKEAVEQAEGYMARHQAGRICGYFFGLYDEFLKCDIGFCSVLRSEVYKANPYQDKLSNDRKASNTLRSKGWGIRKNVQLQLGTHFDKPDEYQVFRRFYAQKMKYPEDSYVKKRLGELWNETKDPLYKVGLKAGEFAREKKKYPGSRNSYFDRDLFEEFKRSQC